MTDEALLLSGGIDSTALCFWKRPALCIFVDYGQCAAAAEHRAATAVADSLGIALEAVRVNLAALGHGNMAGRPQSKIAATPEWWPFRNQLLITLAAMKMTFTSQSVLMIGTVAGDAIHRDGSAEFGETMDQLLLLQEGKFRLTAPARHLTTVELVREGGVPQELLAWTHSCHTAEIPCGKCRGCQKHNNVLRELDFMR